MVFLHSEHALLRSQTVDPRIQQKQMAATTILTMSECKISNETWRKHICVLERLRNAFQHKLIEKSENTIP